MPEEATAKAERPPEPLIKPRLPGYVRRDQHSNTRYTSHRPEVMRYVFAQNLAYGALPAEAYRQSHQELIKDEGLNDKQIGSRARSLAKSKRIKAAIQGFQDELRSYYSIMPEQWLHGMVTLRDKAVKLGEIGSAVRAHELIGKAAGLFVERIQIERGRLNEAEAIQELKRIAEQNPEVARIIMQSQPKLLEGEVIHVEPKASTQATAGEATPTPAASVTPGENSPTSQAG